MGRPPRPEPSTFRSTLLHVAAERPSVEVVTLLVQAGALTLLHVAAERPGVEVVPLLEQASALMRSPEDFGAR
ncbi:hypothetical protein T484DRAFT_1804728 [Baffinella frigidus]|nr:hypothetical protein T484DRAFT_1804728 [Cryptophyta sp. CCMP2293]